MTLDTEHQQEAEQLLLEVLATPAMTDAIAQVEQRYLADPQGSTQAGRSTVPTAARAIAAAAVQLAIAGEARDLPLKWVANAAHTWHGMQVPASGYGIDNPDNVHRDTGLDPMGEYRILCRPGDRVPGQQSFLLYADLPGLGEVTREGAEIVAHFVHRPQPGEEFVLTVGPEPRDDPRHLCTQGKASFLIVRDALTDWGNQVPVPLGITRTDRPAEAALPALDAVVERTVEILGRISRYWLDYDNEFIFSREANALIPPRARPFGAACSTAFVLAPGHGLLVRIDPGGAAYLGCEVTDPWGVTREYVGALGSLNGNQVLPDTDGTVSYLVAPEDPGVHNWLDTGGLDRGLLTVRWQAFPDGTTPDGDTLVRECRVVALEDAPTLLSHQQVDAAGRAEQLRQRRNDYENRLR